MKYRRFGATPLTISEIGFGCSRLTSVFDRHGSAAAVDLLRRALDAGITFYDTADIYSHGEAETLLGRAFRGDRDRVVIASKGGYLLPAQRRWLGRVKPLVRPLARALRIRRESLPAAVTGALTQDFTPRRLEAALEASLRRLKTDYLDIYHLHSPPPDVIREPALIDALESFRAAGKVRYHGVAADSVDDAAMCLALPHISSLELPFGWLDPEALSSVLPRAAARGLGVIARGCYGGGLLKETLAEDDLRLLTPKWPRILELRRLARAHGRGVLEMALRFALDARGISVALLGMRSDAQLSGNLAHYATRPLDETERVALWTAR